jgi:D-inositol-3-phosphate glycosyltransferase
MVRKNIVLVSHYYPPHSGGIEVVAQNEAQRLSRLGHSITIVTSKVSVNEVSGYIGGVTVMRVRAWNGLEKIGIPFPIFAPILIPVLYKAIKKTDVVHIHDAFYISSFCAAVIARFLHKPTLLTQHVAIVPHQSRVTELIQKIVYATTGKFVFRSSMLITTLNDRVTDFVISCGISAEKLVWLVNGVDGMLFQPAKLNEKIKYRDKYNISADRTVVLFVGRFVNKKGFDKIVAAANEHYLTVCVGGLTNNKETDNIRYLGQVSQIELAEIYRSADIFVLPSEGEGFPLSVQEAMASGLAIVMSDDRGYEPYKLDKQLVKLLDKPNADQIASTIRELAINKGQLAAMQSYSLQYTGDHFLWGKVINQLDSLYDQMLGKKV